MQSHFQSDLKNKVACIRTPARKAFSYNCHKADVILRLMVRKLYLVSMPLLL